MERLLPDYISTCRRVTLGQKLRLLTSRLNSSLFSAKRKYRNLRTLIGSVWKRRSAFSCSTGQQGVLQGLLTL